MNTAAASPDEGEASSDETRAAQEVLRSVGPSDPDRRRFLGVLRETIDTLEGAEIEHLLFGGLAVACLARPRWTHDIDLLLRPDDAEQALAVLAEAGYDVERTDPLWLFKARRDGVTVDLIFMSEGGIYLDDEMLERSVETDFQGERVRTVGPEDLVLIKTSAHGEDMPYHWFDAIAVVAQQELDWDYLLERSRRAARRILSFLIYAQSTDVAIPDDVILRAVEGIYRIDGRTAP